MVTHSQYMTLKTSLPWLQRGLALVGLVAIVVLLGQSLLSVFSVPATSTTSAIYGGYGGDVAMMDSSIGLEEKAFMRSPQPGGLLYDEAIAAEIDQKIIKTGSLDLVVDQADESLSAIETVATEKGGYVESSTIQEGDDGTLSGYTTIRIPAEQFDATMKINLYGCRNTIAPLIPYMKIKGGLIVNTSSMVGLIGVYGYTDYAASKFALIGYSEVLRSKLKPHNIQVNVLCPPDTDTPGFATENLTKPAATHAISASANLLTPQQVADIFFKEIVKDKFLIVPGLNGKFSVLMKRLFPGLVEFVMDRTIQRTVKTPDYA